MEERILKVVSDITGVSVYDIKSTNFKLDVVRARMMYYYVCHERNIRADSIGYHVNRVYGTVNSGIDSFRLLMSRNGRYRVMAEDALRVLRDASIEDSAEWIQNGGHEYIYMGGKKYSIVDVSSRYFGDGYMGLVDDRYATYNNNRDRVGRELIEIANRDGV